MVRKKKRYKINQIILLVKAFIILKNSNFSSETNVELEILLRKIGASATEMADMFEESETRVGKHCEFIRQDIEIAKESAIAQLEIESINLVKEVNKYEQECYESLAALKEANQAMADDMAKQVDAFIEEKTKYLQKVNNVNKTLNSSVKVITKALKSEKD